MTTLIKIDSVKDVGTKKLKILYDFSPAYRSNGTGISIFVEQLYDTLKQINHVEIEKTLCISRFIPTKPWKLFRFFEKILYHDIYLPIKLSLGKYDAFIENQYMFIPLFKPKNTVITTFVFDIGLVLFDTIHTEKHTNNWRKNLPTSIKNSDILITISKTSRNDISTYLEAINEANKPLEYIYAGVNQPINNAAAPIEPVTDCSLPDRYLLCLGTIEPRKNLMQIVIAFNQYKSVTEDSIKLVISGKKGWLFDDLFRYIESEGIDEEVIFTGYVSSEYKTALLRGAKALLFLPVYEGFGIPPLEAMNLGTPVLVSDIPVLRELFENNVLYADPDCPDMIARGIKEILDSPPTQDNKIYDKFNWNKSANKLVSIIQKHIVN